jgi:tripartite-type tricarboxylate transporter receptor subunit TctC
MRSRFVIAAACAAAFAAWPVAAQNYPSKTLRIVVAFPAGGPLDIVARHVSVRLAETMGQSVIVDNRAGANGLIGTEHVARSAPDGYTMNFGSTSALVISPALFAKMPFDTLRDLQGVTLVTVTPELLAIHPSVPARTVAELVSLARARPGQITMGSTSSGSLPHLALELLKSAAKVDMLHVPYKGAAPAVSDLVGGQLHGMFADVPVLHGHVATGRLRPIVVASQKRSPVLPDVPTTVEAGYPAVQAVNWYGMLVPAKTPREVVQRLHEGIVKALAHPDLREKLAALGAEITTSEPDRFQAFLRDELQRWGKIARDSGAKIE